MYFNINIQENNNITHIYIIMMHGVVLSIPGLAIAKAENTNLLIFQVKLKEEEFSSQVDALRNKVEQFAVNFRLPGHSDI